jgi:hypothetical protein
MAHVTDIQDLCHLTRMRMASVTEQLHEQSPVWQQDNRVLQKFWEEAVGSGSMSQMYRLSAQQRRALAKAAADLEQQAEAARKDLLRLQHAAGAIHHAAGT